jgi:asparaginyl-tRNA synthetase
MVEAELTSNSLTTLLKLVERLIKSVINSVLSNCSEELQYFEKYQEKEIIPKLVIITRKAFVRLDYTQAIKVLKKSPSPVR